MSEAVALQNCGGTRSATTDSHTAVKASLAPTLSFLTLFATFAHYHAYQNSTKKPTIVDLAPPAMSPFQERHQPTHAAQPADAFSFAPEEEPIASSIDGEVGPPLDLTFLDHWIDQPTGLWDPESVSQDAINPGLIGQAIAPPFDAGRDLFDFHSNGWTDEVLGFSTGFVSQSAPNETLPFDAELSPFGFNPWMNQPIGLPDAEVASQSALPAVDPASVTSSGAPSYLQDTPFDWTNEDAGMLDVAG
jgi:hypothetical protein